MDNYAKKSDIVNLCFNIVNLMDQQENYKDGHLELVKQFGQELPNFASIDWIEKRLEALREDRQLSEEYLKYGYEITKKLYELRYSIDEIMLEDAKTKIEKNPPILSQAFIMFMNMSYDMINNFGKSKYGPKNIAELRTMIGGLYDYVLTNDAEFVNQSKSEHEKSGEDKKEE